MIRFQGMDFDIWIGPQESVQLLDAWRQQITSQQTHDCFSLADTYLCQQIDAINQQSNFLVNFNPPELAQQSAHACQLLAVVVADIVRDLAEGAVKYPGFPTQRKQQLIWLTWHIMFYEQFANYLFDLKISLTPLNIELAENDELLCRFVRNHIYDWQYEQLIEDNYQTHWQAAEIRLESINDSIDILNRLVHVFDVSKELVNLYIRRIQILVRLGRKQEALETNQQAKAVLEQLQRSDELLKELDQSTA